MLTQIGSVCESEITFENNKSQINLDLDQVLNFADLGEKQTE